MAWKFLVLAAFSFHLRLAFSSPLSAAHQIQPAPFSNTKQGLHESGGKEYVVIVDKEKTCGPSVLSRLDLSPEHADVRYTFHNAVFRGFAAKMKDHCLDALENMTDILHVEEATTLMSLDIVRISSPWGLQRISSSSYMFGSATALDYRYTYSDAQLGAGVDIYIVDTGIYIDNEIFGGRAKMGMLSDGSAMHR